jgi:integrase
MGTVFRKTFTKPLPPDAEIITRRGERLARWKDSKGRTRTAVLTNAADGAQRVAIVSKTYTAKYRDGSGLVREVATGCRDEVAARGVLADLERRAELVKAEVLTAAEDAVADHQQTPIAVHINAYRDHQAAKGSNSTRIRNTFSRLKRLAAECEFRRLVDLNANSLERWLAVKTAEAMAAGNRNEYRQELVGFGNWSVRTGRLIANPFVVVPKADARADRRRHRRALNEEELTRLLRVAHLRPLAEYGRDKVPNESEDASSHKTWKKEPITFGTLDACVSRARHRLRKNPEFVAHLESLGRERALLYKTLVLTGLRKGELASLKVCQAQLDGPTPYLELAAADEKNRQGSQIPLREDHAADLREWLAQRDRRLGDDATIAIPCQPSRTASSGQRLLNVPTGLVRILNRDLQAAGIPKRDERGRTVDVHTLRHSFGTLLSKGGVPPRTAQAAMRHSTINLTMNTYTDPKLLDVHGALDALPALSLKADPISPCERAMATGTDDLRRFPLAPTSVQTGQKPSFGDRSERMTPARPDPLPVGAMSFADKRNGPLTTCVNGPCEVERKGVEPSTSALRTQRSPN